MLMFNLGTTQRLIWKRLVNKIFVHHTNFDIEII